MKIVRLFFAAYLLFLSVYPCGDGVLPISEDSGAVVAVDISNQQHSDGGLDLCSPFCICVCCAAHISLNYLEDIASSYFTHNTDVYAPYFERPLLNNGNSIWQPPKIS